MARIIKRGGGEHITEKFSGITCTHCGCGWSNRHKAEPCDNCGNMMEPYEREHSRYVPGYTIVECACREHVRCEGFTSTCSRCGRDYNWAGQELAPREQWGEETGEHWSDIARIR